MYRKNHKDEFYTIKAKKERYPARSVYKLQEIDEKFKIFKKEDNVLDLGSAPGSWLLYILKKVGEKGKVFGVDIEDIKIPKKTNIIFIKKDIADLKESDFGGKFQVVVADLAPKTTGIKSLDVERSLNLSKKALEIAKRILVLGGNFVCKVFEGEGVDEFFKKVATNFGTTKRFRPKAVIKGSKEFYIVAKGFGARH